MLYAVVEDMLNFCHIEITADVIPCNNVDTRSDTPLLIFSHRMRTNQDVFSDTATVVLPVTICWER